MNALASSERDAARLRRAVRALDDAPCMPTADATTPCRAAAVLVPFVRRAGALSVLFTRRGEHLRAHAGQISFPGGAVEPGDADAVATALRETCEETGIAPSLVEPFGYLDCLSTVSGYAVTPVAGFVDGAYALSLHPDEVDEVFEVPLAFILDAGRLRSERILWRGAPREIYAIEWEGRRIWGATAAILKNLLDRLEALA